MGRDVSENSLKKNKKNAPSPDRGLANDFDEVVR